MITHTSVSFQTADPLLERLMSEAERKSLDNIRNFAGRNVLVEGGGYEKIWLETQPMGGEMYAKRNMEVALNNQLLFMENIRDDGRIPGSIAMIDGVLTPQFNKFQGFCFPAPALNMYYLMGRDEDYLDQLYSTLERFDAYLWKVRDSDGDGCLESWCKYDTGEDHAMRYADAPDGWTEEYPPEGCQVVPMASIDIMSFSYTAKDTLSRISRIRKNEDLFRHWSALADQVAQKIRSYLWSEDRGACLDRDRHHNVMPTMIHNTLRAMYWHSISDDMAERFVNEHLLNPEEFWTSMPLPSVAVNDPLFRNITTNNWSGQSEALTFQRAIRALENYGYDRLIPYLGNKLFRAIGEECIFVQQYDPFTMAPSRICLEGEQDAYGPAMLSVMEYCARMYGVHIEGNQVFWGSVSGSECTYEQTWGDMRYGIVNSGSGAECWVNGRYMFSAAPDSKTITDLQGNVLNIIDLRYR